MRLLRGESLLLIIDMQPKFSRVCLGIEAVEKRTHFVAKVAKALGVPIFATEQVPDKMGGTNPELAELLTEPAFPKTAFSAFGSDELAAKLLESDLPQIVLVGVESHICVTQTALDLLAADFEVFVVRDAITSRTQEANDITWQRLSDAGAWIVHSESVVYEWLQDADDPQFRDILQIVKETAG